MSASTQTTQVPAGVLANGNLQSFVLERCQQWFDARGQGPYSLGEVGRIVRQKPETAGDYATVEGFRFTELRAAKVLEPLAESKQWDLFEQIMGIDVAAMAQDLASHAQSPEKLEGAGGALRELSVN